MTQQQIAVLDTEGGISFFRLLTLRQGLYLEMKGMTRRGRSCFAIVKAEFHFKGSKATVLAQLDRHIDSVRASSLA